MELSQRSEELQALCTRIQETIRPYAGRVEYGNLRIRISEWDCGEGEPITNIALVYETPGGSTDQINVSYSHSSCVFSLVHANDGEFTTSSVEGVLEAIHPRITGIPEKRREHLCAEIRRQVDSGSSTAGVFGQLNRFMQSEFRGGTITHLEMRDAMMYAMQYMKGNGASPR